MNELPFEDGATASVLPTTHDPEATGQVVKLQPMAVAAPLPANPTPMGLIQMAIQQGSAIDLDRMERLMQMQERWDKEEARKAFLSAMAEFRANAPELHKNCVVDFTSAKGRTNYKHADLEEVSIPIGRVMGPLGLSFRFEPKQANGRIFVTTILQHSMGHSESITLEGAPDDSGNKNNIQAVGSTITYLERYGLLAITGMAVKGQDDDGRGSAAIPLAITQACEAMGEAVSLDVLQKLYTEAYKKTGTNKTLQGLLIEAKDKRKAEIQKGGAK